VFAAFRDRLLRAATLEDAYLSLVIDPSPKVPPLLLDHVAHAILRGVLDGCGDAFRLRAAECLFRAQRVTLADGAVLLGDEEMVEALAESGGAAELDVLREENAAGYFARSDRFDTVLDVSFTRPGLDGLCRALEAWVRHFLGVDVRTQPQQAVSDERWAWHTGLDAESSALLNDLYAGRDPGEERRARLLALFRLDFLNPAAVRHGMEGCPVYLGIARDARGRLRLKPQNLLVNLPLGGS